MMQNITNEQRKIISGKRITMEVSPYEAAVIEEIRKYSHGEVVVVMLDNIPYRVKINQSVMMEQSAQFEEIVAQIAKKEL